MAKCKIKKETKEGLFCSNFPLSRFYIVRLLSGEWIHHYPRADGSLPEGYSSKNVAEKFVKKWYSDPTFHTVKIVSGKQAIRYEVPKRW